MKYTTQEVQVTRILLIDVPQLWFHGDTLNVKFCDAYVEHYFPGEASVSFDDQLLTYCMGGEL